MKNKHLVGFYRQNNVMQPIYSDKNTFFDTTLHCHYQSLIVPLTPFTNNRDWETTDSIKHCDPTTQSLIQQRTLWITSTQETSPFYALMYTHAKVKEMTRTGYLLVKTKKGLQPVIVNINNKPYLFEMKGCGSPSGEFPNTHIRNQAGCYHKSHIKITGALRLKEGQTEFETLQTKEKYFQHHNLESEVKALALTQFDYLKTTFSIIIRLVPSSLRASFSDHPEFDAILSNPTQPAYYHMGQRVGALLNAAQPLKHENLSINNMVYIKPNEYDLTDWSEVSPLYEFHCALDYCQSLFPIFFLNKAIKIIDLQHYIKGLQSTYPTSHTHIPKRFNQAIHWHQKLLQVTGKNYYVYRKTTPHSWTALKENIQFIKSTFPTSYFNMPSTQWIKNTLLPSLSQRIKALQFINDQKYTLSSSLFKKLTLFQETSCHTLTPIYEHLKLNCPDISIAFEKRKPVKDFSNLEIGQFISKTPLLSHFLLDISTSTKRQYALKQLTNLHDEATSYINTNTLHIPTLSDFLNFKSLPSSKELVFYLYPFLYMVYSIIETEIQWLKGALQSTSDKSEQDHIKRIIHQHESLISTCVTSPETIKNAFCSSDKAFINLFTWPT